MVQPQVLEELWRQMNFNEPYYISMAAAQDLNISRDAFILDVGCGTGKMA
jgi:ubiquinone/menaquinone biosynthesis C-methylase UbiE